MSDAVPAVAAPRARLLLVLVLAVALLLGLLPAPAHANDPTIVGTACPEGVGVTVVVDFTALRDEIHVGCAPGAQANGFEAFHAAGFTTGSESGPGTVCTVNGLPTQGYPFCWTTGGFWSYWNGTTGTWGFSSVGVGGGPLPIGSVRGLSWAPGFRSAAPRIAVADLPLPPPPDLEAAEQAAATWVAEEYDRLDGVLAAGGYADVIFALAGTEAEEETAAAALAALEPVTPAYIGAPGSVNAGPLAKVLLAVLVGGRDPATFAGRSLETELRATLVTDGPDRGRFGTTTVLTQALAILALARTDDGVPVSAVEWLAGQQCPHGGFAWGACTVANQDFADGDHTGLALQALLAADGDEAAERAVTWLLSVQGANGSFSSGVPNSNSTGLAGQALRAAGEVEAADRAGGYVVSLQYGDDAEETKRGAIAWTATADGALLLATTQGVLTLGAGPLNEIGGAEPPVDPEPPVVRGTACAPGAGVTMIVDFTHFDQGVRQGCALGTPATGVDALVSAGFASTFHPSYPGFICTLDGLPADGECMSPSYWSYWHAPDGGEWTYSQSGAGNRTPPPGSIEGWRFGDGTPPSIPPASDPDGQTGPGEPPTEPPPTGPPTSPPVSPGLPVGLARLSDTNRITTAVRISQESFGDGEAGAVVLARADEYADALAGTPLATSVDGPLLITHSGRLAEEVGAEIRRVLPAGGTVHVLGGSAALAPAVEERLVALGYEVVRLAGGDRIATALAVADALGDVDDVLLTTAYDFPDALAAGAAAAARGATAVLLTTADQPHPAVDAYLAGHPSVRMWAVGGPAARAYPGATGVFGPTREGTAVAVAERFFDEPQVAGLARRDGFADALAGGAHIGRLGGPLLLTPSTRLAGETAAYLCATASVDGVVVYGGSAAIDPATADAAAARLSEDGCA